MLDRSIIPWLQAIAANPADPAPRLVFADWLEDHGDARAGEVRSSASTGEVLALFLTPELVPAFAVLLQLVRPVVQGMGQALGGLARALAELPLAEK